MTTKKQILKDIRKNCLECSDSEKEVRSCTQPNCPLFQYRMGVDPNPARTFQNLASVRKNNSDDAKATDIEETE